MRRKTSCGTAWVSGVYTGMAGKQSGKSVKRIKPVA